MSPAVTDYLTHVKTWREELQYLRTIALDFPMEEELKWSKPCYTLNGAIILMIADLKNHCWISFFKGALLKDGHNLLQKPGENTQAGRVIRFTSVEEIAKLEPVLRAYIQEAIEVEQAGLKVERPQPENLELVEELQSTLANDPELKTAFEALTPGRRRAYNLHFAGAKQSATRLDRIVRNRQRILDGFGMNDCTCGLSKRMPGCDGSHKLLA